MIHAGNTLAATNPVEHVIDKPWFQVGHDLPVFFGSDGTVWPISNATIMLIVSALVTWLLMTKAAKNIMTGKSGRSEQDFRTQGVLANLVESVCVFLRDDVFRGVLGDETDRFCPMLWTLFWFILINNLLGLVPFLDGTAILHLGPHGHGIGGTATQSIWVTGGLATVSFLFYNGTALKRDPAGYFMHLTGGAPWFMWVIMVPVEIAGTFIKPFALAIRLFANMTGGHLVIAVLLSFVGANAVGTGSSVIGAIGINLLEVLVAFIQAYIFTFLTCLFLGQLVIHEHEEHDEHGEHHGDTAHEHLPHATPTGVDQTMSVPLNETGA